MGGAEESMSDKCRRLEAQILELRQGIGALAHAFGEKDSRRKVCKAVALGMSFDDAIKADLSGEL